MVGGQAFAAVTGLADGSLTRDNWQTRVVVALLALRVCGALLTRDVWAGR